MFWRKKKVNNNFLWVIPRVSQVLADAPQNTSSASGETSPEVITSLLAQCGISAICVDATAGNSVVTYSFNLKNLKDFSKVKKASEAISARLGKSVIFEKSILPGADFSLAVERSERTTLHFKNAMLSKHAYSNKRTPTACILGADTQGNTLAVDIAKLPHLLIAGATGSGKSVQLHSIISSILLNAAPSEVKFLMVDVKMIELPRYNGIAHMMQPVITDAAQAVDMLARVCLLMDERYAKMAQNPSVKFPHIIVIVDELSDLMMLSKKSVEDSIVRLSQKARAANINLILATQSPRASVLTGLIRSNIPARIGLATSTAIDSRICIERNGCESLLGKGDGFFIDPAKGGSLQRFQAAYISDSQVDSICSWWRDESRCKEYQTV